MKRFSFFITLCIVFSLSACKKCYDCTKVCGSCTKAGAQTLFGCTGDAALQGFSVEAWKAYLETQGYTCSYNNQTSNGVCDDAEKNTLESNNYNCVAK